MEIHHNKVELSNQYIYIYLFDGDSNKVELTDIFIYICLMESQPQQGWVNQYIYICLNGD